MPARGDRFAEYLYARTDRYGRERISHTYGAGGTFAPGTTRTQAKKEIREKRRQADRGQRVVVGNKTVNDAGLDFLATFLREVELGLKASRTYDDVYEPNWRLHIAPVIGHLKLEEVTENDIKTMSQRVEAKNSASTAAGVERLTKRIFSHARMNRWTTNNPFEYLSKNDLARSRVRPTTKEAITLTELETLISYVSEYVRPVLIVMAFTGMGISECLGLTWADVHLERNAEGQMEGYFTIELQLAGKRKGAKAAKLVADTRTKTKTPNRRRANWMTPEVVQAVLTLRTREWEKKLGKEGDLIVTTPDGKPLDRHTILNAVRRAAKRAGLRHLTLKDMRVTVATEMDDAGVAEGPASRQTGHTPEVRRKHYIRPSKAIEQSRTAFTTMRENGWRLELGDDLKPVAK